MEERPEPIGPPPRNSSTMVTYVILAVMGVAIAVLFFRGSGDNRGLMHPAIGEELPALVVQPLTGSPPPITSSDLQGKVSLLNFWGPWCHFCLKEMPHLVDLQEKYADEPRFQLISVSCSQYWGSRQAAGISFREDLEPLAASTERYLTNNDYSLATYADAAGRTRAGFTKLAPWQGYPTTLMIDSHGVIRAVWIGFSPGDELAMEDTLRGLLRE